MGSPGRKGYLFAGSDKCAQRLALAYTLFDSCHRHGVNPLAWVTDVLGWTALSTNLKPRKLFDRIVVHNYSGYMGCWSATLATDIDKRYACYLKNKNAYVDEVLPTWFASYAQTFPDFAVDISEFNNYFGPDEPYGSMSEVYDTFLHADFLTEYYLTALTLRTGASSVVSLFPFNLGSCSKQNSPFGLVHSDPTVNAAAVVDSTPFTRSSGYVALENLYALLQGTGSSAAVSTLSCPISIDTKSASNTNGRVYCFDSDLEHRAVVRNQGPNPRTIAFNGADPNVGITACTVTSLAATSLHEPLSEVTAAAGSEAILAPYSINFVRCPR